MSVLTGFIITAINRKTSMVYSPSCHVFSGITRTSRPEIDGFFNICTLIDRLGLRISKQIVNMKDVNCNLNF